MNIYSVFVYATIGGSFVIAWDAYRNRQKVSYPGVIACALFVIFSSGLLGLILKKYLPHDAMQIFVSMFYAWVMKDAEFLKAVRYE